MIVLGKPFILTTIGDDVEEKRMLLVIQNRRSFAHTSKSAESGSIIQGRLGRAAFRQEDSLRVCGKGRYWDNVNKSTYLRTLGLARCLQNSLCLEAYSIIYFSTHRAILNDNALPVVTLPIPVAGSNDINITSDCVIPKDVRSSIRAS